jgi:hypothetical protein
VSAIESTEEDRERSSLGSPIEVIEVSEDPKADASPETQPGAAPDTPLSPDVGHEVAPSGGTRLSDLVASRLADQARRTAQAARAGRVANTGGEPGVLDLTPLRDLVSELTEELRKVRARERIARALRQAADVIDPPKRIL